MKRLYAPTLLRHCANRYDPQFIQEMERLHSLFVAGRWGVAVCLWMCVGLVSLWALRHEFVMITERFTWAAVRYGLAFNILPTLGLSICVGPTVALLVWQARNIVFGLPKKEVIRLEKQVLKIKEQGSSHPLWRYVCDRSSPPNS
ncbi:MAG: hypothetical protein F6K09_11595 [Merismopedia sp. SIO2A8]|nr:hypothetical protein [Merismopedia sp. SIO2A8]